MHKFSSKATEADRSWMAGSSKPTDPIAQLGHGNLTARTEQFRRFLDNSVPIAFLSTSTVSMLREESNQCLDLARSLGIDFADITIGSNCLPTWPEICWDPQAESLQALIRVRFDEYDFALRIGDLLQQEIITKSNRRLDEARLLGIGIDDIYIGKSLLPEWNGCCGMVGSEVVAESSARDTSTDPITATQGSESGYNREAQSFDHHDPQHSDAVHNDAAENGIQGPSDMDISQDSDSSDHEDDEGVEMNNFVSGRPIYDDYGRTNIVHDADVVGASRFNTDVDIEVYLADENDEEYDDLPDIELAIDRESFEYHFGDDGAVEIHIQEAEIFCFDEIEEVQGDEEEASPQEAAVSETANAARLSVGDNTDGHKDADQQRLDSDMINIVSGELLHTDGSESSEEMTSDEEQ